MELSLNNYVNFLSLEGSLWGWLVMSVLLILVAQFRPFLVVALMSFYPTVLWSASWKPFVTLYPTYSLMLFFFVKHIKDVFVALFEFRYGIAVWLSLIIVAWSFMSPVFYSDAYGKSILFSLNPNYQRGLSNLFLLIIIPTLVRKREDIRHFFVSSAHVLMFTHVILTVAAVFFLLAGHSLYELHLMRFLNTPPVFWESGLLVLLLAYFLVNRKMSAGLLIIFCILALFGLILGNSRTRFLATFLCGIYFIYPYINVRIVAWTSVLVILILSSLAVLPGVEGYFSRLIDQRVEQSVGKSFSEMSSGRESAYDYAYNRWQEKPLLGVGSCYIFPKADLINKRTSSARVHNYYLEVLAGQGLSGFSLLVVVLGICLVMILKIVFSKADAVMDGRMLVALFMYGTINWMFKESWGITYSIIALLSVYGKSTESGLPSPDADAVLFETTPDLIVSQG